MISQPTVQPHQPVNAPGNPTHLTTMPLSVIQPSGLNPRKRIDESQIAELAAAIRVQGLLQNLVVRPHPTDSGYYQIVAGERRYRALQLLVGAGDLPEDYLVAVRIQELSDHELLLTATTENIQRQSMTPLEEGDAYTQLIKLGDDAESIALRTGVSLSTVCLRLKLASGLCSDAKRALTQEQLTLGQAHALLLASKGLQRALLPRILEMEASPKDIRRLITQDKIPVGRNIFPLDQYTAAKGSLTRDIFQPEHPGWFDDQELFLTLQNKAIEDQVAAYQAQGRQVALVRHFMSWEYTAGDGVVIVLNDYDYSVEIHEGLVNRPQRVSTPSAKQMDTPRVNRRRSEWEATTITRAIHLGASQDFRLCLILNIMMLLGAPGFDIKLESGKTADNAETNRIRAESLQQHFDHDRQLLTATGPGNGILKVAAAADPYIPTLMCVGEGVRQLFTMLKQMTDNDLQALFARLTAVRISHGDDRLWNSEVKRLVAEETQLELKLHFDACDRDYLNC
jgi:ParB/RepB/Spo0J family partition protein